MSQDDENQGAIPSIGGKETAVLGAPETKKKAKTGVTKLFLLVGVLVGLSFVFFAVIFVLKNKAAKQATQKRPDQVQASYSQRNEALAAEDIERTKREIKEREAREEAERRRLEADRQQAEAKTREQQQQQRPNPGGKAGQPIPQQPTTWERRMSGDVLANFLNVSPDGKKSASQASDQSQTAMASTSNSAGRAGNTGTLQGASGSTSISSQLQPTILSGRSAGTLPNLDYLLKRGTMIPCALKTGIDTSLPGFVICNVINDVYSANGKTLLVERGASIFGEQQSQLKPGQARTFVLWTRVDNPSGVFANLDSPGTDQMGFNGVPGFVDTHFWERFGAAILLTVIKDLSVTLSNELSSQNGNTQVNVGGSNSVSDPATEILKSTINIPPNLVVNPGTVVHVLVARDVSFENVYQLEGQ